jgi:hypothetical protein
LSTEDTAIPHSVAYETKGMVIILKEKFNLYEPLVFSKVIRAFSPHPNEGHLMVSKQQWPQGRRFR